MTATKAPEPRALLIVGAIVGAVLGAALGVGGAIGHGKWAAAKARKGWTLIPALVAKRDLAAGTTLAATDVEVRDMPDMFASADWTLDPRSVSWIGEVVRVPVAAGEPLRTAYLARWVEPRDDGAIEACTREAAAQFPPTKLEELEQIRLSLEVAPK